MKRIGILVFGVLIACAHPLRAGTIPLTGTIRAPNGALLNGRVDFTLSYAVARDSSANNVVVASKVSFPVRNGSMPSTAQIVPNDVLQPGNTTYLAEYFNSYGFKLAENVFYVSGPSFNLGTAVPSTITTSNIFFNALPWTYAPATNYPLDQGRIYPSNLSTDNPNVVIGSNSTGDLTLTNAPTYVAMGNTAGFVASGATQNASVLSMGIVNGSYASLASNKTGSGSYLPLALFTNGSEAARLTTDPFLQLTRTNSSSAVCAAGTVALRNNAGVLQRCENGAGWTVFPGAGTSGVSGSGTIGYLTQFTATTSLGNSSLYNAGTSVYVGATTTDLVLGSNPFLVTIGNNGGLVATGATSNATVLSMTVVNGSYTSIASNKTGTGTYLPLAFFVNGSEVARFPRATNLDGSMFLGSTTTDLNLSGSPSYVAIGNTAGFAAAGATSNASVLSMSVVNGSYASLASNKTGSGTYLPMAFFTNGAEKMRLTTGNQLLFGNTATDVGGTNIVTVGDTSGFVAAGAVTNASVLSMSVVNGTYTSLASNRTGSGTYLPMAFFTNAQLTGKILASGTDRQCIWINGALRLLSLSGSNVVDGGACP